MNVTTEQVEAGQAVYTQRTLALYDFVVLTVSNQWIWQCPTPKLLALYNQQVTANHLDVGVGTGYFLDCCQFPTSTPRLALMDLNPNALDFAAQRVARYQPEVYQVNVLEPIALNAQKFDSVSINYLLHCLPGTIASKSVIFEHLKGLMNPNAILFGSTLLQGGVPRNGLAKRLMQIYNQKGIFSNASDDLEGLQRSLHKSFTDISVEVVGCAALFCGRV